MFPNHHKHHESRYPLGRRHHHPHHDGPPDGPESLMRRRRGGRGRVPAGDVRSAVLLLLAEEPMHGYQLMQAIRERSGGVWSPSPGAIYPTIAQLEDEGLVSVTAATGRRLVTLTEAGTEHVSSQRESWPDPFPFLEGTRPGSDLRGLLERVRDAAHEVGRNGTEAQVDAAGEILREARKALYLLLAEDRDATDSPHTVSGRRHGPSAQPDAWRRGPPSPRRLAFLGRSARRERPAPRGGGAAPDSIIGLPS